MYKSSKYNHYLNYNNKFYAYNLLTTSIVELNNDVYQSLLDGTLKEIDANTLSTLFQEGFVVSINTDETAKYQYYYDNNRYLYNADVLSLVFIPTYNCNLRCPYCYEGLDKKVKKIKFNEIDAIVKFVNNAIASGEDGLKIKKLIMDLYGGEPLTCKKELIYFCDNMYSLSQKYEIPIVFDMTTNFTLLDDELIEIIKKYSIKVQVSIDGKKEDHDKKRIYKSGLGTYDVIINNLKRMKDAGLKDLIVIRVNLDSGNAKDASEIYDELKDYSYDVYFGIITHYSGFNDNYQSMCMNEKCSSDVVINSINDIYEYKKGEIAQNFGKKGPCTINSENKFYVDCNLDVYKCDLLINHAECSIGHIDLDGNFIVNDNFYKQMSHSPFKREKCLECKYLPICAGGCCAKLYIDSKMTDGDMDLYECEFNEEKLNSVLKDYIKRVESND